ncbi:alpha-2-macroglobulin family protein [Winogradskyella immobilis]|uniref:Alpha-2-macroglobulin n=1 Tax=Winogradskyella immobilis TaxID=2816852 RepID=A0ABS8END8_9FLAO|nr:MG2 domain-containing protein [Winogradskyella immobilis]MCC1484728.1 alpha-2-macroglobulin [Winogradskyella immobilis]MCG0016820.1 alpha-2-macroglobulin [Winogradskyella immobilis]
MKHYLTLLILICFSQFSDAQDDYYEKEWAAIQKLEKDGLTKSASQRVDVIYKRAKAKGHKTQIIKSLLFKSKYLQILEEDAQLKIVNHFKSEIETSNIVTKRILENLLATMYWQYFQQNRFIFYNRSKTKEKVSDDFRTWDLETLFAEIHKYYQRSLKNGLLLQQEDLNEYKILLNEVENSKTYRPTLYDLLHHNALQFYKTDENSITQPAYQFKIDNPDFLANSDLFINLKITSKDSVNLQLNALKIYQNLLKFHRSNSTSKAFVNLDIERLNFIKDHATFDNKLEKLLETLKIKVTELVDSPLSGLYHFEMAQVLKNQSSAYNPQDIDHTNRWKAKEALDLCNTVISKFPDSDGAKKCGVLKQQILNPDIAIRTEQFLPINKPSRALVTYKNLDSLNFKIYKVRKAQLDRFNKLYQADDKAQFLSRLTPKTSWIAKLTNENDYQLHSTEVVLPKLENGFYIIKTETLNKDNVFAATHIQVTDLVLVESSEKEKYHYQVIDRNNGKPIVNAKVELTYSLNNGSNRWTNQYTTNNDGKFIFNKDHSTYRDIDIKITHANDVANFDGFYIYRDYNQPKNNNTQHSTYVFSDRSIYRPGQTVYFKGIITQKNASITEVASNKKVKATLHNVNGEQLSELEFTTNAYGSFHGEFVLPSSGLTGNFNIKIHSSSTGQKRHYFSVEEYKRPKFKTTFQPITDTYKVNDSVTVKGNALAFAGSNITDAKVVYRVKRIVQLPRWYYWRRPSYNSAPQEITFGENKTNAKGEFEISFKAIPDATVDKDNLPVFNYEVTADVTDINGETRSATTTVSVGYHTLIANIIAPSTIDKSKKDIGIGLNTSNLNGEFAPAKGILKIYKLTSPKSVLRQRSWDAPDYQALTESEFKTLFPNEPYKDEHLVTNWKKGKLVFETDFNTETSKTVQLKRIKNWASGKYIILLESKDKYGQLVKDEVYTTLYSDNDTSISDQQLFDIKLSKTSYTINDTAKLSFGSAAKGLSVTLDIEKEGKITDTQIHHLNNSKTTITLPISKNDLGGFVVHYSFSAFNDFKTGAVKINVPYPKTDLEIITKTFRDKLQPGQDETWSFTIKGPKGDKVTAEILASMYDASLDEFKAQDWSFNPIRNPIYAARSHKSARQSFGITNFRRYNNFKRIPNYTYQGYDQLHWFGFYFGSSRLIKLRGVSSKKVDAYSLSESVALNEITTTPNAGFVQTLSGQVPGLNITTNDTDLRSDDLVQLRGVSSDTKTIVEPKTIQIRKNLQETAFFFPQLQTDASGNVSFNFTAPEALTQWKLQLLAHTKTLESSVAQFETVTQKELMVIPNAPRFLREGDDITISTKIANLTEKELSGSVRLELTDPTTGKLINDELSNTNHSSTFSVDVKGNTQVSWQLKIPEAIQAVEYKIIAQSETFSDGEQNALPVLSNRMLVTETLPMWVRSNQTKTFTLDKLATSTSNTLKHHKLTLEMTSNPAWYAVQALPYLMEYPYECNEQTFSRYYANALAQHIVTSNPRIEAVFNQWKSADTLLSNLEKNQELKSILIEETPWLRDAQSETEQKKRIGLLFDLNKMNNELQSSIRKLKNNQSSTGGWPWFYGGRDNRYITQHIIGGFGHLDKLGVTLNDNEESMIKSALRYLDNAFVKEYKDLKKYNNKIDLTKDHLSYSQLHYLYVRSFYPEIKVSNEVQKITDYYIGQIKTYWLKRSLYAKGLMTLTLHRHKETSAANKILKSLKENSITSEELGMYWKANTNSWYWYQAPIETQALLIEAFSEAGRNFQNETKNLDDIDNMKIWLLKNKQTNQWKTTKATTEAVYALLLQGSDWLSVTDMVDVTVGNTTINPSILENVTIEAGTGYYKTSWNTTEIKPEMAKVTLAKKGDGIAWGGLYWQYFEDLDKITSAETPLKLSKKLFLKTNTDKGEEISEITKDTKLNVGDLVRIRIELRSDRPMEFIHLKDMRAAGFEPINVISKYKWQDGLGYYESTKDASTNFFIDYLPKGIFVFEYDVRVNNAGDMSNGISTIQSMYAPEFSSHSEGVRITVN